MRKCRERKRYLSGAEATFECELVALEARRGILRYVIERPWQVAGLTLEPGIVTYAFYWTDRPYNLYWWQNGNGETVGFYFNLADAVSLSPEEFVWRDLIVDILVLPGGGVRVIDEDEVPEELEDGLRSVIEAGKDEVLRNYQDIIQEVEVMLARYVSRAR
jgi:predicted RNA-binding protein associated with RNAse of E/G family